MRRLFEREEVAGWTVHKTLFSTYGVHFRKYVIFQILTPETATLFGLLLTRCKIPKVILNYYHVSINPYMYGCVPFIKNFANNLNFVKRPIIMLKLLYFFS